MELKNISQECEGFKLQIKALDRQVTNIIGSDEWEERDDKEDGRTNNTTGIGKREEEREEGRDVEDRTNNIGTEEEEANNKRSRELQPR